MNIVILDGFTINPGDLSWSGLEAFGQVTAYDRTSAELVVPRIGDAEIVYTSKCIINQEVLDQCPHIKWIGVLATGYNNIDLEAVKARGISVTNIPAYSTPTVAQHTMALLLELTNQVGVHSQAVKAGEWSKSKDFCFWKMPQMELAGKTMGIVGFGRIGRQTAALAQAFGMKVLISTGHPDPEFIKNNDNVSFADLDTLLPQSDVVALHCPLRDENKGLVNKKFIEKMKADAFLLNPSRGGLVVESDLADALKSGKLRGAALDVMEHEPPSDDNPLLALENCIITPHVAWIAKEARIRLIDIAVENLKMFLAGTPCNQVV